MNLNTSYSKYQPKVYHERTPIFWWIHRWVHIRFIARELTSVFVALFAIELLFFVRAIYAGLESYASFVSWLDTPLSLVLHAIAFLFVIFHSVTWFNLAPKALVLKLGTKQIPGTAIVAANFLSWIVLSILLVWLILS